MLGQVRGKAGFSQPQPAFHHMWILSLIAIGREGTTTTSQLQFLSPFVFLTFSPSFQWFWFCNGSLIFTLLKKLQIASNNSSNCCSCWLWTPWFSKDTRSHPAVIGRVGLKTRTEFLVLPCGYCVLPDPTLRFPSCWRWELEAPFQTKRQHWHAIPAA